MTRRASNPFYQPAKQWQIRITVPREDIAFIEEAFQDLAQTTSSFEVDEATNLWAVDIVTDAEPDKAELHARLVLLSGLSNTATPELSVAPLETKDWLHEVEKSFPPLHVGRFYVYGSHVTTPPPPAKIALQVNAGAAFGSGEHATTSGCLRALQLLARQRRFFHPLDMGCGSGILALAIARLWHVPTLGVDIDPVSVQVSRGNARKNRLQRLNHFEVGNGYECSAVRRGAPFDLIIANILARPLMRMAPDLNTHLAPGGIAVLSGLLDFQERMVLERHHAQGLIFKKRLIQDRWHTLVLARQ